MKELETLQEKIGLLLQKSTQLKEENKRLQAQLQAKDNTELELQVQQEALQAELATANLARQDTQQLRSQVDTAISELDKILNLIDEQEA